MGATGIVTLALGGLFGYQAYEQNRQSKAECRSSDPTACTPRGVELREDAKGWANLSTIVTTGGAALVAGSLVILVTVPRTTGVQSGDRTPVRVSAPDGIVVKWGGAF